MMSKATSKAEQKRSGPSSVVLLGELMTFMASPRVCFECERSSCDEAVYVMSMQRNPTVRKFEGTPEPINEVKRRCHLPKAAMDMSVDSPSCA
jgi:hypothetical protein